MASDPTTIAIMEEEVLADYLMIDIDKLYFLPDNPRVYAITRKMRRFSELTREEKQRCIYESLLKEQSVKNLMPQIQRDGGLQEPIIVRWDTQEVIEGNSRLAAYRKLSDENPDDDRWTRIKCLVVKSLTDDQQTRLLGQIHLHGKTDWSTYAKKLSCFRWVVEDKNDISTLAKLYGITEAEIKKNVEAIQLALSNNDSEPSNISYYDVLIRNRKISSAIADNKPLKDTILSQIKTNEFTAQQMRDRLPVIIAKTRMLKKYEEGNISFEEAYERAKISNIQQRFKKIREHLDDIQGDDIKRLERSELRAVEQTVRQIRQHVKRISGMIKKELET